MNVALIIAGGVGKRMKQDIPKQFLNVNDSSISLYSSLPPVRVLNDSDSEVPAKTCVE